MKMTHEDKVAFANKLREINNDNFDAKNRLQFWGSCSQKWQTNMHSESYAMTLYSLFVMDVPHRFIPDEDCEFAVTAVIDKSQRWFTHETYLNALNHYNEMNNPAVLYNKTTNKILGCKNITAGTHELLRGFL